MAASYFDKTIGRRVFEAQKFFFSEFHVFVQKFIGAGPPNKGAGGRAQWLPENVAVIEQDGRTLWALLEAAEPVKQEIYNSQLTHWLNSTKGPPHINRLYLAGWLARFTLIAGRWRPALSGLLAYML